MKIMAKVYMSVIIVEPSLIGTKIYGNVKIAIMKVQLFLDIKIFIMMTMMMNIVKMEFLMLIKDGLESTMDKNFLIFPQN